MTSVASLADRFVIAACKMSDSELASQLQLTRQAVWRARTGRTTLSEKSRRRLMLLCDPSGEVRADADALIALLDVAAERPEIRQLLAGFGDALLRIYATE